MFHIPHSQVAFLGAECHRVINAILDEINADADVNVELIADLTQFFLRDIYRIDQQQRGAVSLAKLVGYWAFWIRKLKPISNVVLRGESRVSNLEANYINEIVALEFAIELAAQYRGNGGFEDVVMAHCKTSGKEPCPSGECFKRYARFYFSFSDGFYYRYIIYSMRNRTFGPHHFALLIENLLFGACQNLYGGQR